MRKYLKLALAALLFIAIYLVLAPFVIAGALGVLALGALVAVGEIMP